MSRLTRPLLASLGSILAAGWALGDPPILRFDEVAAGMRGTGRTVFEGTRIETFEVEVLGKLPNVAPDRNLILGRLSGGPLGRTGVLAGMSGSPVWVDDKLIGAVAYTWGFASEPIAGITPIEEMLALADAGPEGVPGSRATGASPDSAALARLHEPAAAAAFLDVRIGELLRPLGGLGARLPLAVSGIAVDDLTRALPDLARSGFLPLQAGGGGRAAGPAPPLAPGSAMGLKLVAGDVEIAATGTVTWVDGQRVLGLGHPLFGLGAIDLPLTSARVETLLPSLLQSARLATPLEEVGALRQDRASGVLGRLGARPRMIPVRLQLSRAGGPEQAFSFEIADDPLLAPVLLYVSLNGILASKERVFGNATVRLRRGSVIKLIGSEDVSLDNLFAGPQAFGYGTGLAAYILHLLMNNTWTQPQVAGVNLLLDYDDAPRTARVRRVALDRYRAAPGETVQVTVFLAPYRGPEQVLARRIALPTETPTGSTVLAVGGALEIGRAEDRDEPVLPRSLDQLIWLINRLRRNDQIYVVATQPDAGVLLDGARLPNLPPSVAGVLARPRSEGNFVTIPERLILEETLPTEYAVEGAARVELEVEPR